MPSSSTSSSLISSFETSSGNPNGSVERLISGTRGKLGRAKERLLGAEELREIKTLALPALGSLLADPLMSLIDTSCVGRFGSLELAALGPNTALFNVVFQLFTFLGIATTGMVARAGSERDMSAMKRTLANAVVIAAGCGIVASATLLTFGVSLLGAMGVQGALLDQSLVYLRIRALAIPAVLVCTCAQGGCLGQQDARTPLGIFLVAGLFNLIGDFVMVLPTGLNLGLQGAALATLGAQYVAAIAFMVVLQRRRMLPRLGEPWPLPRMEELSSFFEISGVLLLGSLCRMGVYTMMTVTATAVGLVATAVHQIALQIFWALTYFVDPLFVAATSFIARDAIRKPERVRSMATILIVLSCLIGMFLGGLSYSIPVFSPTMFTQDAAIIADLKAVAPLMGLSQLLSAVVLVGEGILIGCGDLTYLLLMHCLNLFLLSGFLYASFHLGMGITGIWIGVLLNQALRFVQHSLRAASPGGPFPKVPEEAAGEKEEMNRKSE